MSQKIYGDLDVKRKLDVGEELKIKGSSSGSTTIKAPTSGDTITYTLPSNDGEVSDVLKTDGSGNLSWVDNQSSAGCATSPSYVDNGGGSVTINAVDVKLFNNSTFTGSPTKYTVAQQTFTLTDNARNYIVADYNAGTPILRLTLDVNEITESNIIPVYTILRAGSYLNFLGWDTLGRGLANKLHQATVKTERYKFENAWAISEYGTRNLNINTNNIYVGANKVVASSIATATDNIRYFLRTGPSAWTYTSVTQYNNTEYFNGTSTVTLSNNRYAVNWLYRGAEETPHIYMVLGEGDYNLSEAQNSQPPASLPFTISGHAFLIGRVIVQKNAAIATQINSVSQTVFTPSATSNHEDLAGLLGGAASEHYHLTGAEYSSFGSKLDNSFESVSKNLRTYPYVLNYTGSLLTSIVYNLGSGQSITKTLNYTTGTLTSVVLSGNTPSGILLTKTLGYTGSILTSITYS